MNDEFSNDIENLTIEEVEEINHNTISSDEREFSGQSINNEVVTEVKPKSKKGKKSGFGKVLKRACALILSGLIFGSVAGGAWYGVNYLIEKNKTNEASTEGSKKPTDNNDKDKTEGSSKPSNNKLTGSGDVASSPNADKVTTTGDDLTVSEIAKNCLPSVVAITNVGVSEIQTIWGTYEQESVSCGSGVIIGMSETELIILTNYHVVADSKELTVVFSFDEGQEDAEAVAAAVKGYDAERDVAVIAINIEEIDDETMSSLKIAVIGDSDELVLGEPVVAIGNALGYGQSVTTGIVSALDRYVELDGTDNVTISNEYIQTDAAINPGNSGGALLNMKGELIGINSAKLSGSTVEGVGYAIPIDDIEELVTELMNMEIEHALPEDEQGYLCISGQDVPADATLYGVPKGAYVVEVYEGYAAANAGIEAGDIITKVNDVEISSMNDLKRELSFMGPETELTLTIVRQSGRLGFEELEIEIELDDYETFQKLQKENQ